MFSYLRKSSVRGRTRVHPASTRVRPSTASGFRRGPPRCTSRGPSEAFGLRSSHPPTWAWWSGRERTGGGANRHGRNEEKRWKLPVEGNGRKARTKKCFHMLSSFHMCLPKGWELKLVEVFRSRCSPDADALPSTLHLLFWELPYFLGFVANDASSLAFCPLSRQQHLQWLT